MVLWQSLSFLVRFLARKYIRSLIRFAVHHARCANLAEAWRKRRYEKAFVSKLSDVEGEAAETQVWLTFAVKCGYIERDQAEVLYQCYREIIGMVVSMINNVEVWIIRDNGHHVSESSELYGEPFG